MGNLLSGNELQAAYDQLLSGRVKLVGWGCIGPFPYYFMTSPLIPDLMVDNNREKWGRTFCGLPVSSPSALAKMDPSDTIIMIYPIYSPELVEQILGQIAQYGPFRTIPPFHPPLHTSLLLPLLSHYGKAGSTENNERLQLAIGRVGRLTMLANPQGLADSIHTARLSSRFKGPAKSNSARLFIGRLQPGGAERQLTYLARGLAATGWDSILHTFSPPLPGAEGYLTEGVGLVHQVLPSPREFLSPEGAPDGLPSELAPISAVLCLIPLELMHHVAIAYCSLMESKPSLVVSYLDTINVAVGIAALLAGVPYILISGRSLNPTHFPNHYASAADWLKPCYDALLSFPELRLNVNSVAGARSYQSWLNSPEDKISVTPNGLPHGMLPPLKQADRDRIRQRLNIPAEALLIVGVFRLADEKRPLLFVETVGLLLDMFEQAHAVLVGDGPLRANVDTAVGELNGADRFHVIGARADATDFLGAADLVLHTAWAEGHPNVLMEAQLLGRPIVCTASHGTVECLYPSPAILVEDTDNPCMLAEAARAILSTPVEAAAAASPARAWLLERFSIGKLVQNSLEAAGVSCLPVMKE